MNRFAESRLKLTSKADRLAVQETKSVDDLLKRWLRIRRSSDFCELTCSYSPEVLNADETDESFYIPFHFFSPSEIKAHMEPGEDCISGKDCFPIGGDDETLVYLIRASDLPVSIVHIEEIWSAKRIDKFVKSAAKGVDLTPPFFLRLLQPQAFKTTLGVEGDGRYWLIVEKRNKNIRADINFENEAGSMRWNFRSEKKAREKYFEILQHYISTQDNLILLDAPSQWRRKIESLLS